MTTYIPPMPSGVVRSRRAAVPFAEVLGPAQFVAEGLLAAVGAVSGAVSVMVGAISRHRQRRSMMGELAVLPDHTLSDIGLHRSGLRIAVLDAEKGVDPRGR